MTWVFMQQYWPTFPIPEDETLCTVKEEAWLASCRDLDVRLVRATIATLGTREFPPGPGQLAAAAAEVQSLASGDPKAPSVDEAWHEFKEMYQNRGPWSHPAVEAAAKALGCKEFGMSETADEMAWRAHFLQLYRAASERMAQEARPTPPALADYMDTIVRPAPRVGEGTGVRPLLGEGDA